MEFCGFMKVFSLLVKWRRQRKLAANLASYTRGLVKKIFASAGCVIRGIPKIEKNVIIRARNGSVEIGSMFSSYSNSAFTAVNGGTLHIGRDVFFNRGCNVIARGSIWIGDGCMFGPNVSVYDHNHRFSRETGVLKNLSVGEVVIGDGCWIGAGAVILKGAHIGDRSVIGANAVVSSDIPPCSIVSGVRELQITPMREEGTIVPPAQ
jgi:acetyltransferase-like isoleucine patch superfamily enzyme